MTPRVLLARRKPRGGREGKLWSRRPAEDVGCDLSLVLVGQAGGGTPERGGSNRSETSLLSSALRAPAAETAGAGRAAGGARGPHPAQGAEVLRALESHLQHGAGTIAAWGGTRPLETHTAAPAWTSCFSVLRLAGLGAVRRDRGAGS